MPENVILVDRNLLKGVVATLKTLEVTGGYPAYDKLVGCVLLLEQMMNPPEPKEKEEETENG